MDKPKVPKIIKDARNKPEFNFDCLTQIDDLDPHAPRFIEFDWELLRRNLGEAREEMGEADFALLANVLGELLRWLVKGSNLNVIGRRTVALAWVVNPEIFKGVSMRALAHSMFNKRKAAAGAVRLQELSGEVSRVFGVRNRGQDHASNWKPGKANGKRST